MIEAIVLILLACSEPLPESADGRMHAAWEAWQAEDWARAADAVLLLSEADGEGELTALTETPGVMVVNPLPGCTVEQVEDIVIALNQDELFDIFDHYDRSYTSPLSDWEEQREQLDWQSDYGFTIPLAGPADATLMATMREQDGVLFAVNTLAGPAVWEEEGSTFDEDFRLEAWTHRDGAVVHVEGLWRHMIAGAYNTENEAIRDIVLNGLVDWDEQMVELCEQGLP